MSIIKVENLSFSYTPGYDNIFDNVSFQIDTDWKTGLIGRNGKGKTTFLNLLQGKYDFDGTIISSVQFDYFPYRLKDTSVMTQDILYQVCPTAENWKIMRELSFLDVDLDVLYRPFETLSNGEQTKVLLAGLFLNEEHFLLIDEPTNHLDMKAREIVSAYLKKKRGFILVSHDRSFLDGCVDHILSFNRTSIEVQSGNFSSWFVNFERQQSFEQTQNKRLRNEINRLKESSKRTAGWSEQVEKSKYGTRNSGVKPDKGFIGHKAAKMMQQAKNIEARRNKAIEQKSVLLKDSENPENLKIAPQKYHSELLVSLSSVIISYDGKKVCGPVTFDIMQGDRLAVVGKNGCGKSSLLKLLLGNDISYSGKISAGSRINISYVPQDTSFLKGNLTDFAKSNRLDESLFKAILRKMDFERIQFEKDLADFSAGQKKKVLIAKSLCEKAHLYIWDEPLNYVDVYSRMQIENLLNEFKPTIIFVEHDKAFQEAIATKVINL